MSKQQTTVNKLTGKWVDSISEKDRVLFEVFEEYYPKNEEHLKQLVKDWWVKSWDDFLSNLWEKLGDRGPLNTPLVENNLDSVTISREGTPYFVDIMDYEDFDTHYYIYQSQNYLLKLIKNSIRDNSIGNTIDFLKREDIDLNSTIGKFDDIFNEEIQKQENNQ